MISAWVPGEKGLVKSECNADALPPDALWVDLNEVSREEETLVEARLGVEIPTRAEMQEIEASSRLYRQGNVVYMTATLLIKTETEMPETTPVTFIFCKERMITLRYGEPWSFRTFGQRAPKSGITTAEMALLTLQDITVERLADLLEIVQVELEHLSQKVFRRRGPKDNGELDLQRALSKIGACGNILGKVRESLLDKNRMLTFAQQAASDLMTNEGKSKLRAIMHDIQSLSDHASFTSGKLSFLLDATLGMINNSVNQSMRMMSVLMIAVMWPALVSGFFAMNVQLPMPQTGHLWPFYLCVFLAFGPLIIGGIWYWRHRRKIR